MATYQKQPIPNAPLYPVTSLQPTAPFLVDGAIDLLGGGVALLTKATAGAYTLAVPTVNGIVLKVTAVTAAAHVITQGTVGFNAKGSSGTATFGGAKGDCCILVSYGGNWYSLSSTNVTFA
jgi:hypothetical protein